MLTNNDVVKSVLPLYEYCDYPLVFGAFPSLIECSCIIREMIPC